MTHVLPTVEKPLSLFPQASLFSPCEMCPPPRLVRAERWLTVCFVMEYTPGGTLRSRHPKGTHLSLEQIVTSVKQLASALDYAHQQRVIHRDIKLDNLLLNAKDEVVLSDFGLAVVQRTLDSLSTQNPAGTPLYMASEQIQRKPCAASDQYALGIMVYEWLTGEPPFRGALFEVFSQHLYQPPPS